MARKLEADRFETALRDELYALAATLYDDNPVAAVIKLRALAEIGGAWIWRGWRLGSPDEGGRRVERPASRGGSE